MLNTFTQRANGDRKDSQLEALLPWKSQANTAWLYLQRDQLSRVSF